MTPQTLLRKLFPPMLATLTDAPPSEDANWTFELKYDGFRGVCAKTGGDMALWSRNELDLGARFPKIVEALEKWKADEIVVDGEIVALNVDGVPKFELLQQGNVRERYVVFDLLWLHGKDVRGLTYLERRELLKKVVARSPAAIELSHIVEGSAPDALAEAAREGWEGLIAKRNDSIYEPRRSKAWLKIKALNMQELAIVGFNPSTHSDREIGSLHLAVMGDDGALHYAGKVGTGFSYKLRVWLKDELSKDVIPQTAVKEAPRERVATWVKPRLVAQVAFTEWTSDNKLRHPSFLGLRDDKSPEETVRERPEPAAAPSKKKTPAKKKSSATSAAAPVVKFTHPERVLYPKDKITKQDVADYYAAVSDAMITTLKDRPLTLEHWNSGIDQPSWFHQNVGKEAPPWANVIETPTRVASRKTVRHLVADKPETLQWLAQMSVLTVHMWSSRGESLEEPDWLVFDLDPAKGKGIAQAIDAAIVIRRLLENLELPSVPKTSGKRGIHVFVPLQSGYSHEDAANFACSIAAAVSAEVPYMTVERSIDKRRGRLYLDCMQNGYGKTMVAPYSLRAIDGAPVSAPLKWSEITKKLDPLKFNLRTMPDRLAKLGDLFEAVFKEKARLPKLE
ncbi:MAG: bifunctional non-ous end joining protein LigD [Acidobacteriota bacterium]|jgi:bifunctional non-homologous end joining protein LigD|nr:bifunctional non-ous end joining protein LigD [Acidobacteriota bacterium]